MSISDRIREEIAQSPYQDEILKLFRIRRECMDLLHKNTGNSVILYASSWLQNNYSAANMSINPRDIKSFMDASYGLWNTNLDLILHSPGGSNQITKDIVSYLRSRFQKIRVIVPDHALSVATTIACAADQIVMGEHSFLSPTDSQVSITTQQGTELVLAQAIRDEFDRAKAERRDKKDKHAWMSMIDKYHPGLSKDLRQAFELSRELMTTKLINYFESYSDKKDEAERKAEGFSDHEIARINDRRVSRKDLEALGMNIMHLEDDQELQEFSMSVFRATTLMFKASNISKVVENHEGYIDIS